MKLLLGEEKPNHDIVPQAHGVGLAGRHAKGLRGVLIISGGSGPFRCYFAIPSFCHSVISSVGPECGTFSGFSGSSFSASSAFTEVHDFLSHGAAKKIHLERLPPQAPDVYPAEWLWRQSQDVEMANLGCLDLEELHLAFHWALGRVVYKPHLVPGFFAGTGLAL